MASSPQTVSSQAVSTEPQAVSTSASQAVSSQEDSASQAASASSQAVSISQTGSSWEDNSSQAASTSSPQTVSSQAVSADPQMVSASASQEGNSWEESTSQADSAPSQTHSTNSQGGSATLFQVPQVSSTNTTQGSPGGNSLENPKPKWVINLSSKPLTQAQRSGLAKGPNFVVTPRHPPNLEYITTIEAACTMLSQQDAEELRAEINRVLRSSHLPNLT